MLLRLEGGAKGTLVCSQIACGEENRLALRVYGTEAGLEWHQQEPNTLIFKPAGKPWELLEDLLLQSATDQTFATWINELRRLHQLRNDDVTLLGVGLE